MVENILVFGLNRNMGWFSEEDSMRKPSILIDTKRSGWFENVDLNPKIVGSNRHILHIKKDTECLKML